MSESETGGFDFDQRLETPPEQTPIELEHTLVEHDDRPDELGVTPVRMENGRFTEWIVAREGSFVDLREVR